MGTNSMPPQGANLPGSNNPAGYVQFGSSTTYGPWKISVGPDDMVYLGDGSGGESNTEGSFTATQTARRRQQHQPLAPWRGRVDDRSDPDERDRFVSV